MSVAQNSGIGLVTGSEYKMSSDLSSMGPGSTTTDTKEKKKAYPFAMLALALGIIGIVVSLNNSRSLNSLSMAVGVLAAIALIVLMFQVKSDILNQTKTADPDVNDMAKNVTNAMKISVDFTLWYYLSILSFLAAAFVSYKKRTINHEITHAPQVPINNPGEQSEFPAAPLPGETLG